MNIQCNEKPVEIAEEILAKALVELGYQSMCIATAINGEFVPRSMWARTVLSPGDQLEVVAPMQGG